MRRSDQRILTTHPGSLPRSVERTGLCVRPARSELVDSPAIFIEHPQVVADRFERVVGGPKRVIAGTDCGFDTSARTGRVAEDVVWAKLTALADGAKLASDRLVVGAPPRDRAASTLERTGGPPDPDRVDPEKTVLEQHEQRESFPDAIRRSWRWEWNSKIRI